MEGGFAAGTPSSRLRVFASSREKILAHALEPAARPQIASAAPLARASRASYNVRMNATLKITRIGNSAGIILPKEVLAQLGAEVGETLSVVTTPRGIELSVEEPDFDAQMAAAREVMARRKRALRELAK